MAKASTIEASVARSNFALLSSQAKLAPVKITRHGQVEFVIVSPELFDAVDALNAAQQGPLEQLQERFDSMFGQMQSDHSTAAYDALAALSADELTDSVAKAYGRSLKPRTRRPKIRVVR